MNPRAVDPGCTRCGLSGTRTQVVPGKGDRGARLVLVGEAPGRDEDLAGQPFVGRAGRILDRALVEAGIDRGPLFITNLVKCRPPGNRRPRPEEALACMPQLEAEIREVRPRAVVLLGLSAAKHVLGREGRIADLASSEHEAVLGGVRVRVFVTYHPAACIYGKDRVHRLAEALRLGAEAAGLI